jgi:DNA-binding CsgD family transcriptional regulator
MTQAFEITRTFNTIVDHDKKFPFQDYDNPDSEWIMAAVQLIENCFPNSVLMLCKINHQQIAYVSNNAEAVISYTAQYLKATSAEEYFNLIHPDDRASVLKLYVRMEEHTRSADYLPENWKFAFHYRLRMIDGNYRRIQDEKAAFLQSSGKYVHYSILSVFDDPGFTHCPSMILRKRVNQTFQKVDHYIPKTEASMLTQREHEVLKYIDAGLSTKEIASRLSISPNTIRNHKTSLFRKTEAKSGLQALKNARRLQLL